mmetsp:Transcript_30393/g.87074  ORF Transcript_30393/g.87074 Transcript_30393/m.87074 type:complete len:369 (+) Transcript_30393:58-1164(+)
MAAVMSLAEPHVHKLPTLADRLLTGKSLQVELSLRVMSFNVWWDSGKSLDSICEVIQRNHPDLVGLQECSLESAQRIGKICGLGYAGAGDRMQPVLSRWPIEMMDPQLSAGRGFRVILPGGQEVLWFNVHLRAYPYPPYVLSKPDTYCVQDPFELSFQAMLEDMCPGPAASEAAVMKEECHATASELAAATEQETQLPDLIEVLEHARSCWNDGDACAILLTGDFNAASHLDYPSGPSWPCSRECASFGLIDSFAKARALGIADQEPAQTWAAKPDQEPHGLHDRIDYVYYFGDILLEWSRHLDGLNSGVSEWPSDHRAVLSALSLSLRSFQQDGEDSQDCGERSRTSTLSTCAEESDLECTGQWPEL